jgi:hypothetical protein
MGMRWNRHADFEEDLAMVGEWDCGGGRLFPVDLIL